MPRTRRPALDIDRWIRDSVAAENETQGPGKIAYDWQITGSLQVEVSKGIPGQTISSTMTSQLPFAKETQESVVALVNAALRELAGGAVGAKDPDQSIGAGGGE